MIDDTQAKIDINNAMATSLARLLGDRDYKPNQVYHYAFQVVTPDGRGFIVNTSDRTHYRVGCLWPRVDNREYYPEGRLSIGVAKARPEGEVMGRGWRALFSVQAAILLLIAAVLALQGA
jgi:hypothetical protein